MDNTNEQTKETMTFVEYIKQNDQSYIDEYNDYCKQHGLNPDDEDSAMSFIEYYEDEVDANMEN